MKLATWSSVQDPWPMLPQTKLSLEIIIRWISYGKQFRLCVLQKRKCICCTTMPGRTLRHSSRKNSKRLAGTSFRIHRICLTLPPTDFHLFRSMQHFSNGKEFENDEEVKSAIFTFFASKPQSFFQKAISALVKPWHFIADSAGEDCPDKFVE